MMVINSMVIIIVVFYFLKFFWDIFDIDNRPVFNKKRRVIRLVNSWPGKPFSKSDVDALMECNYLLRQYERKSKVYSKLDMFN